MQGNQCAGWAPGRREFFPLFIEIPGHVRYIWLVLSHGSWCMIVPKKSLGQNFLQDENVARNIVGSLNLSNDQVVLEIGPGKGALTKYLCTSGAKVIGVELDARAAALLRETFGSTLELIESDVLEVKLVPLLRRAKNPFRVVGNIPYYISTEILFWMFDQREAIRDATVMVQLEVARRFVAKPRTKDYGILSVITQFHTHPKLLFTVSRNSFYPKPNVDSAVVRLDFKAELPTCNLRLFKNLVRSTFGKRRKTLRNGLRFMGFTDTQLEPLPVDLGRRPEELSVDEFLELTKLLEPFEESIKLIY